MHTRYRTCYGLPCLPLQADEGHPNTDVKKYKISHHVLSSDVYSTKEGRKEGSVLFNDALNTFTANDTPFIYNNLKYRVFNFHILHDEPKQSFVVERLIVGSIPSDGPMEPFI